jgi:mitochondrial import inner membrane translocase subunit TIM9
LNDLPGFMDLNQLPEHEKQQLLAKLHEKQSRQFMDLYNTIVNKCFTDCVNSFTSESLNSDEKDCLKNCTIKQLKLTNRIGQQLADNQIVNPSSSLNN